MYCHHPSAKRIMAFGIAPFRIATGFGWVAWGLSVVPHGFMRTTSSGSDGIQTVNSGSLVFSLQHLYARASSGNVRLQEASAGELMRRF